MRWVGCRSLPSPRGQPSVDVEFPVIGKVQHLIRKLLPELSPFDYGRFAFRLNPTTGEMNFLEVNRQCNIWLQRVIELDGQDWY